MSQAHGPIQSPTQITTPNPNQSTPGGTAGARPSGETAESRGRHRGPAAVGEEATVPAQGRHRRPAAQEQVG
ncbi:hypothetical protein [Streptomyces macrosporus]|uniref:Uncharacterized protein n=1 Tax=Streptomyces macrosporus TaxID=44032 RepID=A0ABP5X4G6_9ACTN